jgi:hypothetical protein
MCLQTRVLYYPLNLPSSTSTIGPFSIAMAMLVALVQQKNDAGGISVYFIREQKARKPRTVKRPRREIVLESTPILKVLVVL